MLSNLFVALTIILSILSLSSLIIGSVALGFAVRSYIKIEALEKSTHQIQYVPAPSMDEMRDQTQAIKKSEQAIDESYADLEYEPPEDEA